ncbi:unnamed protein product [Vicia faba]|uniref:Uncharacterized protein n=1 Tax=Vicia faba TaxID=3906 RepID=A0AAV1B862_VICFA|nr:unnamed protein product [Vicia faba]
MLVVPSPHHPSPPVTLSVSPSTFTIHHFPFNHHKPLRTSQHQPLIIILCSSSNTPSARIIIPPSPPLPSSPSSTVNNNIITETTLTFPLFNFRRSNFSISIPLISTLSFDEGDVDALFTRV